MSARLRLVLMGPWGPACAAAVFSVLVMGLGGEDVGARGLVEWLGHPAVAGGLLSAQLLAAAAAVAMSADRARALWLVVPLWASMAAAVGAAQVLSGLPEVYAYAGEWTPDARRAQRAGGVCMIAGCFGLAALRVWRRELMEAPANPPWAPADTHGYRVAAALSLIVLAGMLFGA